MADDVLQLIECSGDPRAMGEAQGRALRAGIRARVQGRGTRPPGRSPFSLQPFTSGRVLGGGMGREIARHHPHLSERIQGIAYGADLPITALMDAFVREAGGPLSADSPLAEAAAVVRREGVQARLTRRIGPREERWIVRRSAPQVGFASIEVTAAWLATSVVGVNESGVAAALAPQGKPGAGNAPAAAVLIQECLQRFDSLDGCVDWALKRPVSGYVSIALADASGRAAFVDIAGRDGADRNVSYLSEGLTVVGGQQGAHGELLSSGSADVDWPKAEAHEAHLVVCAEPAMRRLRIVSYPDSVETVLPVRT